MKLSYPIAGLQDQTGPSSGPTRKSLLNQIKLLFGGSRRETVIKLMNFNSGIFTGRMIAFTDLALRLPSYSTLIEISWPLPLQCVFITANGPPNISQPTSICHHFTYYWSSTSPHLHKSSTSTTAWKDLFVLAPDKSFPFAGGNATRETTDIISRSKMKIRKVFEILPKDRTQKNPLCRRWLDSCNQDRTRGHSSFAQANVPESNTFAVLEAY